MKLTKIMATLTAVLLLATLPVLSLAEDNYGSSAVTTGQTYTLEQMLTYAIQDEYMAKAEYDAIQQAFGADAPFANIAGAESTHIAILESLFATYGLTLPVNDAAAKVTVPATEDEAFAAGIVAENANIAMYQSFLAQSDLPEDVRGAFTVLQNASQSHLTAFTRNAENDGLGMQYGRQDDQQGMGRNSRNASDDDSTYGNGTMRNGANAADCPLGEDCPFYNNTQTNPQTRNGGRGGNRN